MARFYIAYIPPQHYDTIRSLLHGHMPDTYDEWTQFHTQKAADLLDAGDFYREVQIDPDEFARHCDAHGDDRTLQGLDRFARLRAAADAKKGREAI